MTAIEVLQLTKVYPVGKGHTTVCAVDHIDFAVCEGEVFGFLGPNGAGKTTNHSHVNRSDAPHVRRRAGVRL